MSLEHPNVVPIHDAGDIDGRLYLAMRLRRGNRPEGAPSRGGGARHGPRARHLQPGRERPRCGTRERSRPSGRQALERAARRERACLSRRLRTDPTTRRAGRPGRRGPLRGHARLPRPRADRRRAGRRPHGCLLARLSPLRVPDGRGPVRPRLAAGGGLGAPGGGATERQRAPPRATRGDRRGDPQGDGQGARGPLHDLRRADHRGRGGARAPPTAGPSPAQAHGHRCRCDPRSSSPAVLAAACSSEAPAAAAAPRRRHGRTRSSASTLRRTRSARSSTSAGDPSATAVGGRSVWVYNLRAPIGLGDRRGNRRRPTHNDDRRRARRSWSLHGAGAGRRHGRRLVRRRRRARGRSYLTRVFSGIRGKREYRLEDEPRAVAVGYGAVWVVVHGARDNQVLRIDPATGKVTKRTHFPSSVADRRSRRRPWRRLGRGLVHRERSTGSTLARQP